MDEDTFAQWLFYRFQHGGIVVTEPGPTATDVHIRKGDDGVAWRALPEETRLFWQHEADAVRRAAERGGFKHG